MNKNNKHILKQLVDKDFKSPVKIPTKFEDTNDLNDLGKRGENNYLKYLTFEGAKKRYNELTDELIERIDFELETIQNTGYPGYFLIV